ncbi:hypothetical protein Hgul01_05207 [Herpetosiphon gulosus]|uniref:Uncharacterized protein n=1 Tax=Herpetosiphon gulosus TaxID=1973496 RepID=A0ABP9X7M0_9CHLR
MDRQTAPFRGNHPALGCRKRPKKDPRKRLSNSVFLWFPTHMVVLARMRQFKPKGYSWGREGQPSPQVFPSRPQTPTHPFLHPPSLTAKETAVRGRPINARCAVRSRTTAPRTAPHKPVQRVTAPTKRPQRANDKPRNRRAELVRIGRFRALERDLFY